MINMATGSIAAQVRQLAEAHNITAEPDNMSRMAAAITRMADDVVKLDTTEQLLVNLKKKGILSKSEILVLQGCYLKERRQKQEAFRA